MFYVSFIKTFTKRYQHHFNSDYTKNCIYTSTIQYGGLRIRLLNVRVAQIKKNCCKFSIFEILNRWT